MYSATPIGGSTVLKRAGSMRTTNTEMGTKFGTGYTFCVRTATGTRPRPRYRGPHCPQAAGYGRP